MTRLVPAMSDHEIRWYHDGDDIAAKILCHVTDTDCRLWHVGGEEDCETPDGTHPGDQCSCGAILVTSPGCNYIDWIENSTIAEQYDGPDGTPVHDGPIEFTWDGDGYTWHYIKDRP